MEKKTVLNKILSRYQMTVDSVTVAANATIYKAELNVENMIRVNEETTLLFQTALRNPAAEVYTEAPYLIIKEPGHNYNVLFDEMLDRDVFFTKKSRRDIDLMVGMDENGDPFEYNLNQGHMIVAGTTGSGKSEFLHTVINSLYCNHNSDIEVFGIDVAKVGAEFAYYGETYGNFHLIDTIDGAFNVFRWVAEEMTWRFHEIRKNGFRDMAGYNGDYSGHWMGHLFVIVDELADLMLTARKRKIDIEDEIVHIAQLGRACGIHLILATQSPRKEIVTGLIKANCDTKVALTVTSATESCIILGHGGAEKLNGKGDMIFHGKDGKETRVQGALVDQITKESIAEFNDAANTVYTNEYDEKEDGVTA